MNRADPDLAAWVSGLGRRLDAVDTHLVRVDARLAQVDQVAADVSAVGRGLAELTVQVRALTEATGRTIIAGPNHPPAADTDPEEQAGAGQPDWLTVTDPDLAAQWLSDAVEFATHVLAQFPNTALPACWPLHPTAVTELIALHRQHRDAYAASGPAGVSEFLARWLPGAVHRIKAATSACETRSGHVEGKHVYHVPALDPARVALWSIDTRTNAIPASEAFCLTPTS